MSKAKQRGLGRGLSALIGDTTIASSEATQGQPAQASASQAGPARGPTHLNIAQLRPGQFQPRRIFHEEELESLSNSLKKKGILQPLLVRPVSDGYEIIAGERRWRAAQKAGLHDVPVVIEDLTDQEALEIGIIENVQRTDLNPIEEAEALSRLMNEFSYTQEKLAAAIGKSRSHIANMLRLVNLPDGVRDLVMQGRLSAGHARALLGASDAVALAQRVIAEELSVRALEKLLAKAKAGKPVGSTAGAQSAEKDADTRALERTLSDQLGLKVEIADKAGAGSLTIGYRSFEQLDDVIRRLMRS